MSFRWRDDSFCRRLRPGFAFNPQRRLDDLGDEVRIFNPCQRDVEHAVAEGAQVLVGGFERQPCFAGAADANQRQQTAVGVVKLALNRVDVVGTVDERRDRDRQAVRRQRRRL